MKTQTLISLHGGHSGQFCCHAGNTLEEMIRAYIDKGFKTVGITEHMPMPGDEFLYPDEVAQGLTAMDLHDRFRRYFEELNRLRDAYRDQITVYRGFETETVTGAIDLARTLIREFEPDYIVGSVHHVNDRCFDYSRENYDAIARDCGSVHAMYLAYFDAQFEMIRALRPFVVGHFDIIRIFDDRYARRLDHPEIRERMVRNLSLIRDLGLVLDYNLRPLARGEKAPYLAPPVLELAKEMDIGVVPGDDAHNTDQAGKFVAGAVRNLAGMGFSTQWPVPRLIKGPAAGERHP